MGPVVAWTLVFAGSLLVAALLAPLVHAGLEAFFPRTRWPPARVVNRLAQLLAVTQLYAWRRSLGWSLLRDALTAGSIRRRLADVSAGFVVALIAVALGLAWAVAGGDLAGTLNPYAFLSQRTATALIGALVVGLTEESFFRGMMLPALAKSIGWWKAAVGTSAAYAMVHCLVSDRSIVWREISPTAGFAYLRRAFLTQLEPAAWPPLLGLFLAGMVLAWVVRRSGSLLLAVGVHAGWALSFQVVQHATRVLVDIEGTSYFAARNWLVGRPWTWAVFVVSGGLALAWGSLSRRARA
jgi:membrane protease YdiL (CAAX protease family)